MPETIHPPVMNSIINELARAMVAAVIDDNKPGERFFVFSKDMGTKLAEKVDM